MNNVFESLKPSLGGPGKDVVPVELSDTENLEQAFVALYVETGGVLSIVTVKGNTRAVTVPDFFILPVGVVRVNATDTTAGGIFGLVV